MANEKKTRKQLAADAEPELVREIGHELVRRDITLRQAMDEAFRLWLGGSGKTAAPVPVDSAAEYPKPHRSWHDKLEFILDRGEERDRIGIQQSLAWAARDLTSRLEAARKRRGA